MKLKALIMDDSKIMRTMIMKTLEDTGLASFSFVEAKDGAEALVKFDPKHIDICFVDWNMPTLNGFDFVKKAREKKGAESVPMIMITSEKSMGKMIDALDQAGANAYVCKPFTVEELQHKLSPILENMK
jgi:two-component system chemotaxis response regulator CheY